MSVVARAASLTNVPAFSLCGFPDRLTEGNLRLANIGLDLVLALHAIHKNLEMQFAHSTDDRLTRFFVGTHLEGRILISQPRQSHAHLFLVSLGLRLNRHRDHCLRKGDRAQRNRMLRRTKRIAGLQFLQANTCANIARLNLGDIFALVGVHLDQTANAVCLAGAGIENGVAVLRIPE